MLIKSGIPECKEWLLWVLIAICSFLFGAAACTLTHAQGIRPMSHAVYVDNSPTGAEISPTQFESIVDNIPTRTTINFESGENIHTEFTIDDDFTTIRSYRPGKANLIGSQDISGLTWTHEGSDIYSCPWTTSDAKWITVDGVLAKLAQTQWYKITSQADGTHLTSTTLNGAWGSSVAGSQVLVREWYFTYSHLRNVTAYSAGQITLDTAVRTGLTEFTFKLYNQLQFLDEVGEWFFDDAADKIYYKTDGGAPTNIRVVTKDKAIWLPIGTDDVTIDDIEISEYLVAGVQGRDVDRLTISNSNVHDNRGNGLYIYGPGQNLHVHDNEFLRNENNAMMFGGLIDPIIEFNEIDSSGIGLTHPFPYKIDPDVLSLWQQTTSTGIVFNYDRSNTSTHGVDGGIVRRNDIDLSGYCGINFTGSLDSVSWNRVDSSMIGGVEDGAAIYMIAQPELTDYETVTSGTIVYKNIVTYFAGRYDNCPLNHPTMNSWGIYVDKSCDNIHVLNNTAYGPHSGGLLKFNFDCHNNFVRNNTLLGGVYGVQFNTAGAPYTDNDGNQMTGNVITTAWYPISSRHISDGAEQNPFDDSGDIDNNFYLNNYGDIAFRKLNGTPASRTLASWQTFTGDDASSVGFPITRYNFSGNFATTQEMIMEFNETDSDILFEIPAGYVDKSGTVAGNDVTIPKHEGVIFVRTASVATVFDTFTGTNGTSISGRTPDGTGGNWTLNNGAITITSNAMVSASSGNATQTTSDTDANVFVQANKGTTGNINILLRHNGSSGTSVEDYIWIFWGTDLISLIQHVGSTGVNTTLATAPQLLTASTQHYLEAQIIGNRVLIKAGPTSEANEVRIDYTGVTMNPSSVIHGFRQTVTGSSSTTTFAISSP